MKRLLRFSPLCILGVLVFVLACGGAAEPTATPRPATPTTAPAAQPVATATTAPAAQPAATATAAPAAKEAPGPKNPRGTVAHGLALLTCPHGVNTVFCQAYEAQAWGIGEDVFTWRWKDREKGIIDHAFPQLAVSWQMDPDGKRVVIETRQGVKFHKGWGEMTAEDIAWSYNMVNPRITPHSIAPSAAYYSSLFGDNPVKALDRNHVEFKFAIVDTHWNTYQMNGMGFVGYVTHPKAAFDKNGEEWMKDNFIGTGPFQVDSWVREDRAVFSVFREHWSIKPQIEKVIIQSMPEDAVRVAALQTGELDSASLALKSVPNMLAQGFKTTGAGNASQQGVIFSGNLWEEKHAVTGEDLKPASSGVYARDIQWVGNPWRPNDGDNPKEMECPSGVIPLDPGKSCGDMEQARLVRWAVAMAIDRNTINKQLLNGLGWPVHIGYADEKNPNWDKKWEYEYNVARAEEFLDKAGYKKGGGGTRFEMPFFVSTGHSGGLGKEIGDAFSGMMSKIGIKTAVLEYPYAVFRPSIVGRTNTVPWLSAGDDGQAIFPFDWPLGQEESSISRGGYSLGYEAPKISEVYLYMAAELDTAKRIAKKREYFDYMHFWAMKPGIVAIPILVTYNPNSIKEWVMEPTPFAASAFWNIVPASR